MSTSSRNLIAAALAVCLAGPLAAQDAATADPAPESTANADTVVATVNGTVITLGHMIVLRSQLPQQYAQLPDAMLYEGILDQLVQQQLLSDSNESVGLGTRLVLENEQRALSANEVITDVANAAVTDEALQEAYKAAIAGAEPVTEYSAQHILMPMDDTDDIDEQALAAELIQQLKDGADFAELAKEHSVGPSAPNGGDIGWFSRDRVVPEFGDAVAELEPGEISEPVQTQYGLHIIRLNETRMKDAPTFEAMRAELTDQIKRAAVDARVAELRESGDVQISTEAIDPALLSDQSLIGAE